MVSASDRRRNVRFLTRFTLALTAVGLFGVGLLLPSNKPALATAGVNSQINYEGRLLTAAGAVVPDGSYNFEFKIYQDGDGTVAGDTSGSPAGTLQWTEDWFNTASKGITVRNGYFSVQLGTYTSLSSVNFNSNTLWLSVNIGGTTTGTPTLDGEMLPMKRLASSPYSLNSGMLGGLTSSQFLQVGVGGTIQGDTSTNTAIALNKTGTGTILDLQKGGADVQLINSNGQTLFRPTTDSQTALQVQKAGTTTTVFTVDTTNARIGINTATPAYAVDAVGQINASTALSVAGTTVCTSSGCTVNSASAIQNTTTQQASSNFNISGTGIAGVALQAPGFDTTSAATLTVGATNATAITLGQNVTIANNKTLSVTNTTAANTVFSDQVAGDTNSRFTITAGGQLNFGSGSAATDAFINRSSAGTLTTNSTFIAGPGIQVGAPGFLGKLSVQPTSTGTIDEVLKDYTGQTADQLDFQDANGIKEAGFSANGSLTLGTIAASGTVYGGNLLFGDGTADNFTNTLSSATLTASQSLLVPNLSGTLAVIQGSTPGTAQTGNINVSGSIIAGTQVITPLVSSTGATTATAIYNAQVTGDTNPRFSVAASGQLNFGSGSATTDTYLYRSSATTLQTNATLLVSGGLQVGPSGFLGKLTVQNAAAATIASVVRAASGQTADLEQYQDYYGNNLQRTAFNGALTLGTIGALAGSASPVAGTLNFSDGTTDSYVATLYAQTLTASQTLTIPNATGVICLQTSASCGFLTGSASSYIQNTTTQQASSNFNISGVGNAGTGFVSPSFDTASAAVLSLGTTNATSISLGAPLTTLDTIALSPTQTGTSGTNSSLNSSVTVSPTATSTATFNGILAYQNATSNYLSGATLNGLSSGNEYSGTSTLGTSNALTTYSTVDSGATITNNSGLIVSNPTGAGTITNNNGVYIASQTKGTTTNYGLYVQGATTDAIYVNSGSSYLGGNLIVNPTYGIQTSTLDAQSGTTLALGASAATTINIGTNGISHTIGIGSAGGGTTALDGSTVNIANTNITHAISIGAAGTSYNQVITIGSTNAGSTTTIQGSAITVGALSLQGTSLDTVSAGAAMSIGTTNAGAITLGQNGQNLTVNSSLSTVNGSLVLSGTSTNNVILNMNATLSPSSTSSVYGIQQQNTFEPTAASLTSLYGMINLPMLDVSSTPITNVTGNYIRLNTNAGYTGQITTGNGISIGTPQLSGSKLISTYNGILINSASTNTGATVATGAVTNYGLQIASNTAAAGSGGTLTNYGINVTTPAGTTSGTSNYGILIQGNGGGASATNYSFDNLSTANSLFTGSILGPSLDVASAGTLSLGATTATTIAIGSNALSHTIGIGSTTGGTTTVEGGTINIGNGATAHTIAIGNGAAVEGLTVGSTTTTSSLTLQAGTTGTASLEGATLNIGNGATAHTIAIGSGAAIEGLTIGSTTTTSSLALQAGATGTFVLTGPTWTTSTKGIEIGPVGTQTTPTLLGLNNASTAINSETAANCTTTVNAGAMYYSTVTTAIRACVNGNFEDVVTTAGLAAILFGVVPDSGTTPGDLFAVGSTYSTSGPCKVSVGSTLTTVSWTACTAYTGVSNGTTSNVRKVLVAAGTATTTNSTNGNVQHLCLSNVTGQPVLSTSSLPTTTAGTGITTIFNPNAPQLCLADIYFGSTTNQIYSIGDDRVYTTTVKEFINNITSSPIISGVETYSGTVGEFIPSNATGQKIAGVIVSMGSTTSLNNTTAGTINALMAISGPVAVQTNGTGAFGNYLYTSGSTGYATGSTTASTVAYGNLGIALTSNNSSACVVNEDVCHNVVMTNLNIK